MGACTLKIINSLQLYTRGRYKAIFLRLKKQNTKISSVQHAILGIFGDQIQGFGAGGM